MSRSLKRKIVEMHGKIDDLTKENLFLRVERLKSWQEAIEMTLRKWSDIKPENRGSAIANVMANLKAMKKLELDRQIQAGKKPSFGDLDE